MIDRYQTPEMQILWSEQRKYEIWRDFEVAVCDALAEAHEIPAEAAKTIRQKAAFEEARVLEIEATTHHDVIAFLTNMAEHIGPDSRYVHLGLTSSDLLDTTHAVRCKESGELLLAELDQLLDVLKRRAVEHKMTLMMGRTHGIHAEPVTFGLKLLGFADELDRGRDRLCHAIHEVAVGKVSGAVGTYAHIDPEIEASVCQRMGLGVAAVSTQVVPRDRTAAFFAAMALIAAGLERMAVEIRHLQRTEVGEVQEPFGKGQKGSSAMPHKKNPIVTERLTGMARLVRAQLSIALENVALWHERDISHSSVERMTLPDATTVLHYMLRKSIFLIEGLIVRPDVMRRNLESTHGLVHSGTVLLALARAGLTREDAYSIVQRIAMRTWDEGADFEALCRQDEGLKKALSAAELDACFDLSRHTRHVDAVFRRVLPARSAAAS